MEIITLEQYKAAAERKLRLFLSKAPSIRESEAFHRFATGLRKEEFRKVCVKLHEQGFLELTDGPRLGTVVLVRKDAVDDFMAGRIAE